MVKKIYIPSQGDIVFLNFSPQSGHEQAGRRPALVLSPYSYNEKSGLCLCVPITTQSKGYPFEVLLPKTLHTKGVVLSDQIRSLDWNARDFEFEEKVSKGLLGDIFMRAQVLLKFDTR